MFTYIPCGNLAFAKPAVDFCGNVFISGSDYKIVFENGWRSSKIVPMNSTVHNLLPKNGLSSQMCFIGMRYGFDFGNTRDYIVFAHTVVDTAKGIIMPPIAPSFRPQR